MESMCPCTASPLHDAWPTGIRETTQGTALFPVSHLCQVYHPLAPPCAGIIPWVGTPRFGGAEPLPAHLWDNWALAMLAGLPPALRISSTISPGPTIICVELRPVEVHPADQERPYWQCFPSEDSMYVSDQGYRYRLLGLLGAPSRSFSLPWQTPLPSPALGFNTRTVEGSDDSCQHLAGLPPCLASAACPP